VFADNYYDSTIPLRADCVNITHFFTFCFEVTKCKMSFAENCCIERDTAACNYCVVLDCEAIIVIIIIFFYTLGSKDPKG